MSRGTRNLSPERKTLPPDKIAEGSRETRQASIDAPALTKAAHFQEALSRVATKAMEGVLNIEGGNDLNQASRQQYDKDAKDFHQALDDAVTTLVDKQRDDKVNLGQRLA